MYLEHYGDNRVSNFFPICYLIQYFLCKALRIKLKLVPNVLHLETFFFLLFFSHFYHVYNMRKIVVP